MGNAKAAQPTGKTQKNRRYRGAKISEYRLRRVVECFAKEMPVTAAAKATGISRQSIDVIYMRIRERLFHHGLVQFNFSSNEPHPVRYRVNVRQKGAPERFHHLYAAELIHRGLTAHNLKTFEELSASNPKHVKRAIKLYSIKVNGLRRYAVFEKMKAKDGEAQPNVRPFAPFDYEESSTLLINERMIEPHTAFFRYLWGLLLRHPL